MDEDISPEFLDKLYDFLCLNRKKLLLAYVKQNIIVLSVYYLNDKFYLVDEDFASEKKSGRYLGSFILDDDEATFYPVFSTHNYGYTWEFWVNQGGD
ncbi:MAG: hypothetical protein ACP5OE_09720 [Thermodesulfobium sp.]